MRFEFVQWHPDPKVHANKDEFARTHYGDDADSFMRHWQNWCEEFPGALKLVTLVPRGFTGRSVQLRFWFGEPSSIRFNHADSMGHNLIVHINGELGNTLLYRLLVERLLTGHAYSKEMIDGVEIWRLQ